MVLCSPAALLIVLVLPLMSVIGKEHAEASCGLLKHYEECGTACPKNCKNWNTDGKCKDDACLAGCFCNEGLVLEYEDSEYCVAQDKCDSCPENSDYRSCGVNCQPRCDGYNTCWWSLRCFPGCICRQGYFLHSGKCYTREMCPVGNKSHRA
ncbi:otogelin-like protein isoform X1 [Lissotriton helveticus]